MIKKFVYISKRLFTHELIAGSFFVFIGSMTNNIFSFLFNLFLVRNFSTSDYGIYASLVSIIALSSFLSQSLITIFVKFAGDFLSKGNISDASNFYKKIFRYTLIFSLLVLLCFIVFSSYIREFLHINNNFYIVLVALITFFSYMSMINEAFIRGLLKFKFLSFIVSFGSLIKLTFGALFIWLGYGIFGALGAVLLNGIVPFLLAFIPLKGIFRQTKDSQEFSIRSILSYAIPASVTILSLASFVSTDIILVKHFFSSSMAGLYGGLSLVGKVIFYFTSPIPLVMFPLIIKRHNNKEAFHTLFYLSLLLVLIASLAIVMFYFFLPKFVVSLFLAQQGYLAISQYIGYFAIFLLIYSLSNVCINFFLSIGKTEIYKIVAPTALFQIFLIILFHDNFFEIITISILCVSLLLAMLLIYYYRNFYGIYHSKK